MTNNYIDNLKRKRDQAWEMAGLARQDDDKLEEQRRTDEAIEYSRQISELLS